MATKQQMNDENGEFKDEFAKDDAAPAEVSEDEAFGISPEGPAATGGEAPAAEAGAEPPPSDTPPPVIEGDAEPIGGGEAGGIELPPEAKEELAEAAPAGGEPAVVAVVDEGVPEGNRESVAGEPSAAESNAILPTETDWEQKYKTLQGKYDSEVPALQEKLRAAASNNGVSETSSLPGGDPADPFDKEGAGQTGDMTLDAAMSRLRDEFGDEELGNIIQAISKHTVMQLLGSELDNRLGPVQASVEQIISHLTNAAQRAHFEKIVGKHPDFVEVDASPEFSAWLDSKTPEEKAEFDRVRASGSADEINSMLDQFKEATKAPAGGEAPPADDMAADAAEGVRSGGIRLPEPPGVAEDDFATAWERA